VLVLGGSGQGISLPRSVEGRAVSTFVKIRDVWLVPGTTGARSRSLFLAISQYNFLDFRKILEILHVNPHIR